MPRTKVKICGLARREDALHAAAVGADYLGVVLVPGTPRHRTPTEARALLEGIDVPGVVVVSDLGFSETVRAAETVEASVIQLHGEESPGLAERLGREGPWTVWKALRVRTPADVAGGLERYGPVVDGLLLDGWHPVKAGGTGVSFSWKEMEGVREKVPEGVALVVAGGLNPGNVGEAVGRLRPDVVDVSSGVEDTPGIKDHSRVEAFMRNARGPGAGEKP